MNTATAAKQALEQKLTALAGRQVEIIIRGEQSFTFFFEGVDPVAVEKLLATVPQEVVEVDACEDLGTCVYVN